MGGEKLEQLGNSKNQGVAYVSRLLTVLFWQSRSRRHNKMCRRFRNKKRVGYTYELSLEVKGEWIIREEKKLVCGYIDVPEFSVGELDDLKMEVRLNEATDLLHQDKIQIKEDLKLFLQPFREKLLQFEQELKDK